MALRPSPSTTPSNSMTSKLAGRLPFAGRRSYRQRSGWAVAALLVCALLLGGSWLAASALARSETDKAQREFRASSAHVASTLQLAIQHEEDLIVSAGGFVVAQPNASNGEFLRWASSVKALPRYPELLSMGYVRIVPDSQLAGFMAAAKHSGLPGAQGLDRVSPPGQRPFYCLAVGGFQRGVQSTYPPGFDLCGVEPLRSQVLSARDSGLLTYLPFQAGKTKTLGVFGPVYQGGTTPATVAARRQALLGWVGMTVVPNVVIARVLQSHPGTAVTMHYRQGTSNVVFTAGTAPKHAQSLTVDLHNGWTVTAVAPAAASGVAANGGALALLGFGVALSLLLGLLVSVLGTGRARAMRLVDEKTRELRVQASREIEQAHELRRVVAELESAQKVLVELARTVEVAEAERMALAADLHDGPIQHLTAVTLRLDLLASKLARGDSEHTTKLVDQLRETVASEMVSLRRLMIELRPPILDQRGLEVALRDCAEGVLAGESIQFELECTLGEVKLVPELETAIYRVVREALTNIRKHADADHARVTVDVSEARVLLTISDDGSGFAPDRTRDDHYGLITMREGVEGVGGTWRLETSPTAGTSIEATLPYMPRTREFDEPGRAAA
jgi:signal transduction histidine kinase